MEVQAKYLSFSCLSTMFGNTLGSNKEIKALLHADISQKYKALYPIAQQTNTHCGECAQRILSINL